MRGFDRDDVRHIRRDLWAAADGKCSYCSRPTPLRVGTVDHYLPTALGGTNRRENLRWSCARCNNLKGSLHPDEWARLPRVDHVAPPTAYETKVRLLSEIARRGRRNAP